MNARFALYFSVLLGCSPGAPPPTQFIDFGSTTPTTVRIRLVDVASPVAGLPVTVLDPSSTVLARGVTDTNGVAELPISMAGHGWLVANDGRGRGTLVRVTTQPGGVNDLGERPLRELTEFPEIVSLRGVGFEERLTSDTTRTVSTFVLADEGRVAVGLLTPIVFGTTARIVAVELATGTTRVLGEHADLRNLQAPGRGDWLVWSEGYATTVVYDLLAEREIARFATPSRLSPGGGWRFETSLSLLFIDGSSNFSSSDPSPVGVIVERAGIVTQVTLFSSTGETWSRLAPSTLWVTNWTSQRLVAFDAKTFERRAEQPFASAIVANDACAFANELRMGVNVLVSKSIDGTSRDLATSRGSNWLEMGSTHDGRPMFRSIAHNGSPTTFAVGSCEGPAQTFELPDERCTTLCVLDATVADAWRLVATENESRVMSIWSWPLETNTTPLFRSTSGMGYASYEGGMIPLVTASPVSDATPQFWLGLPAVGVTRTWFRSPRTIWLRPPDGRRVVYLMRDPLTEVVQLFQIAVAP